MGLSQRVLHILEATGGGTGRHVVDLCAAQLARGCEVHLLYSPIRMEPWFKEKIDALHGLYAVEIAMERRVSVSDLFVCVAIRRYLARHDDVAVVHGHSSKGAAYAVLSSLFLKKRVVITWHGFRSNERLLARWKRRLYALLEWGIARGAAAVIAVSPEERVHARSYVRIPNRVLSMVPNGVALDVVLPTREVQRRALSLASKDLCVGCVSRLIPAKGVDRLLRAFAEVIARVPKAKLVILGRGESTGALMDLAEALNISKQVTWMPQAVGEEWMPAFDVYAMPSLNEGMPYVLLEALRAGLPILTTRIGGCSLVVEEGVNGFSVPVGDEKTFGDRLETMLADAALRASMSQASRERAQRFSLEHMVDGVMRCYTAHDSRVG